MIVITKYIYINILFASISNNYNLISSKTETWGSNGIQNDTIILSILLQSCLFDDDIVQVSYRTHEKYTTHGSIK